MRKLRWARLRGDIEFINPNVCFCAPDIPDPDPQVGASMKANADISKEMAQVARDTLAWNKERAAKQDPLIEKVVQQQIASADTNADRATEQWNIYKNLFAPTEARMVEEANNFDSPERKERMAGEAGADTTRAYQAMQDQQARMMGRLGVNPNSGRFAALNNEMGLAQAKDTAGVMNKARRDTEMQGIALRTGAAQFGRNMPATGISADSLALNGGSQAVGNMGRSVDMNNAGLSSAAQWFGGAQAGNSSAGNLGLGLHQAQLQGAQMQQDALAGLGSLAGSLGSAAILTKLRKGAVIKNNSAHGLSGKTLAKSGGGGGLGMLTRQGYAEGGMIEGPGTGTSDSIPATIEGVQPIRLSNGEAVLNKEAVELVGEDFVHRINAGGLAMLEKKKLPVTGAGGLSMLSGKGGLQ